MARASNESNQLYIHCSDFEWVSFALFVGDDCRMHETITGHVWQRWYFEIISDLRHLDDENVKKTHSMSVFENCIKETNKMRRRRVQEPREIETI